jgi:hypothetical protein
LAQELQGAKYSVENVAFSFNELKNNVAIWTDKLVEVAEKLEEELTNMGL